MKIKNKNNLLIWNFSTKHGLKKIFDSKKFINLKLSKSPKDQVSFLKTYLLHGMTYNTIFFCSKYWELTYESNFIKPILINLRSNTKFLQKPNVEFLAKFGFSNWLRWNFFLSNFNKVTNNLVFPLRTNTFMIEKFLKFKYKLKFFNKSEFKRSITKPLITGKNTKNIKFSDEKKPTVKAFLFARATWNNFFASIIDNNGNTLVTRTGGNSERTGSWQWSTVFSADSAMYEVCFLGWERGVESLSIHIKSTLRLPQIKNSFDGLEASGLVIEEVIYRPLKSFGGCRLKKPRWV